jgi:hypothetical protein
MVVHYRETLRHVLRRPLTCTAPLRELGSGSLTTSELSSDKDTFVAQVGDGDIDHSYLGRAETMDVQPADQTEARA